MMFRFHRRLVFWNLIILLLVVLISGFNFPFSIFAVAVGFLLTMLVSYALKLRVAAPLSELFNAIQKVGDGDLHNVFPLRAIPKLPNSCAPRTRCSETLAVRKSSFLSPRER